MSCEESWKEVLVSRLYDEITPDEEERLSHHLASCKACSEELEELSSARRLLGEAEPTIPAPPRVLVLDPRSRRPFWSAFAAGFAAAGLLLGAGITAGWLMAGGRGSPSAPSGEIVIDLPGQPDPPVALATLEDRLDSQRNQIQYLYTSMGLPDSHRGSEPTRAQPVRVLTRKEFESGLDLLRNQVRQRRSQDLQILLEEIVGVEVRTDARIGETQEALGYMILASDPRANVQ